MKILHVGKFYSPYKGGMETVLRNLVEGLLDEGLSVRALVSSHDGPQREEMVAGPVTGRAGLLVRAERIATVHSQPINPALPVLLRRQVLEFQPHLVHLHLPNPLALTVWDIMSRLTPGRMPGLVVWHHADITRQKLGASLLHRWKAGVYQRCRGVCVSSRSLAEASPHLRGLGSRVQIIPFGIEPQPWRAVQSTFADGFLFVGRLVQYKGLKVLLEAVALCGPEVRLTVVGEGPLEEWLLERLQDAALAERVCFRGACSDNDLVDLMAGATGLILPSLDVSETFGLVQLEAMAAGLPVVASRVGGIPGFATDGQNILFAEPDDVDGLAQRMAGLADDAALRARLSQQAGHDVGTGYGWDAVAKRTLEIYEETTSRS